MAYLTIDSIKDRTFDAIVVGSGISGAWAAKELTGLRTLVLERGRDVKHIVDYPTTMMNPWEFEHLGQMPKVITDANPIVSRCYAFNEDAAHSFVKDAEHPYSRAYRGIKMALLNCPMGSFCRHTNSPASRNILRTRWRNITTIRAPLLSVVART